MANRLDPKDFGLKLYNLFPLSYRLADADQRYALRRYLEAASDGGFKYVIEEQNGILDLIDPHTASMDVVHCLYEQYGLNLFHGIPEEFLRSFLPNLGSAWAKKGSLDVIEYLVSSLSGIKTTTVVSYDASGSPIITVRIEMDVSTSSYFPNAKQFERLVANFIPYYCDTRIVYSYVYAEKANHKITDSDRMWVRENLAEVAKMFCCAGEKFSDGYNTDYRTGHILLPDKEIQFNRKFLVPFDPDILVYDRVGFHDHDTALANNDADSFKERVVIIPTLDTMSTKCGDKTQDNVTFRPVDDVARVAHPDTFLMNYGAFNSDKCFCVIEPDTVEDTFITSTIEEVGSTSKYAKEAVTEAVFVRPSNDNAVTKGLEKTTESLTDIQQGVIKMSSHDSNVCKDAVKVARRDDTATVGSAEHTALSNSGLGFNSFRFNVFQHLDIITKRGTREAVFS